jgi:hypothetical protein
MMRESFNQDENYGFVPQLGTPKFDYLLSNSTSSNRIQKNKKGQFIFEE